MSPEAIHGTGGAYVPCEELAAELPPLPEGAIVGQAAGFVARDEEAAGLPTTPYGAIRGSQVGFVSRGCPGALISTFAGVQTLDAAGLGGPTSVVSGPTFTNVSGGLRAWWNSYDAASGGSTGNQEVERRTFTSWLLPLETAFVEIVGSATALHTVTDTETNGQPQTTDVDYEMGQVVFDPDTGPTDFDDIGSGLGGTVSFLADFPTTGVGTNGQTPVPLATVQPGGGGTYVDVPGDIGPPGTIYRLFQLSIKVTSTVGLGRHTILGFPDVIEVLDRFPDNPNWDSEDFSQVESGVLVSVDVFAYA